MGIIRKIFGAAKREIKPVPREWEAGKSTRTLPRAELPTGERTDKQHPTSQDDIDTFLNGAMIEILSSNVARAQYDSERQTLYIWYLDGALWAYDPYTEKEAAMFLEAPSAGGWLADNVRDYARGIHAHKRNARRVS